METPLSEDDSELEELLSQLEDESLLELKLTSFRHGSGRFVTHGKSGSSGALSEEVEKRYENLKAQSFRSGGEVEKRVHSNETGTKDCKVDSQTEVQCVKGLSREEGMGKAKMEGATKFFEPGEQQEVASKGLMDSPPSSPSAVSPRCSCFCISSRKPKKQKQKQKQKQKRGHSTPWPHGKRDAHEEEDWSGVLKELEDVEHHKALAPSHKMNIMNASLFDLKTREKEFKRASKREKDLTQEAQKFVDWIASSSDRLSSPPHYGHY